MDNFLGTEADHRLDLSWQERLEPYPYIDNPGYMDRRSAILTLGALAQETRLDAFQLLVRHEPNGLPAGDVARQLDVPQNTMSAHLATLARAGLVRPARHSRQVIYHADCERLAELASFLIEGCCSGQADLNLTSSRDAAV